MCTQTHLHACIQAHTQERMTVNHERDACVRACVSGFENEEKSQRAPGDVAYSVDGGKDREQERERSLALLIFE